MEDFSYQPFLLDPAHHLPLSPLQVEEASNGASCFLYYHTLNSVPETSTTESKTHESSSSLDVSRVSAEKRGNRDGSCSTSVQLKNSMEAKSRKQRKPSGGGGGGGDVKQAERKKLRADEKEKDACEEPPVGYIHVRARRGQATDSHSLSERARREKIGERMKLLQTLVPGCDKVVGKALMLDEIINYVQSLQNQVEFLSMKLAAMNPVLYNFGVDFDGHLNQLEKLGSINQASHFHLNALEDTPRNYPTMGTPPPFLLHTQGPITFSQNTASLMQMGDQRSGFLN